MSLTYRLSNPNRRRKRKESSQLIRKIPIRKMWNS